jgi:hypothetical protein
MNVGDIVYFKSTYTARYDRYRIDYINDNFGVRTGDITNLEDGTRHFAHSEHWKRIITVEEYRELQLNQLGL